MKRVRARRSHCARRAAARRKLRVEQLEALLLMSATPHDAYEAWKARQFTVGDVGSWQTTIDPQTTGDLHALGNGANTLIGGNQARAQSGYTGGGYAVAILDTGIDYRHPALAANYAGGWDFVDNDSDPLDLNGHGTHVAGIIGSRNANYLGVAPDVKLISLRVLDANGSGNFGDVEEALQWVAQHRAQYNIVAVNMSLGAGNFTSNPYTFLEDELQTLVGQGVFIASAAGNSYYSYGSQQGLGYPAISNQTVAVGAVWDGSYGSVTWGSGAKDNTTAADRVASFTQRSSGLDIFAPGAFITSTYLNGQYATLAGTSMAAPVVAGAAVIVHQALDAAGRSNQATQDQILAIMKATGVTIVDGDDENDNVTNTGMTFKRLNLLAAVNSIGTGGGGGGNTGGGGGGNTGGGGGSAPSTTADQAFVSELYRDLLGRSVDTSGLSFWTSRLQQGLSRAQVVQSLWNSSEHLGTTVNRLYSTILDRSPGASERNYWVQQIQSSPETVDWAAKFLHSSEYVNKFGNHTNFLTAVYQDVFGRTPDAGGLNYWLGRLQQGVSRHDVINVLLDSQERFRVVARECYQEFLGRAGSGNELSYWADMMRSTRNLTLAGKSILASSEYYAQANSAGARAAGADGALLNATGVQFAQAASSGLPSVDSVSSEVAKDPAPDAVAPSVRPVVSLGRPAEQRAAALHRAWSSLGDDADESEEFDSGDSHAEDLSAEARLAALDACFALLGEAEE